MSNKLILSDGTEIELESSSSLGSLKSVFYTKESMVEVWEKMTNDNLKKVKLVDSDGNVIAEYENLVFESVSATEQADLTILAVFSLREKTEVELLREQTEMLTACVLEMSEAVYA